MVNTAQSYIIFHFSINYMLPLVILAFPRLMSIGYIIIFCINLSRLAFLLVILGFTRLTSVYFPVKLI